MGEEKREPAQVSRVGQRNRKSMKANTGYIDRRTFLRGAGAAIALPFLESIALPHHLRAADGMAREPMRMLCVGLNYGLYPGDFFPEESGRNYQLSKLLQPLAGLRDDFTVFSQLDHPGVKGGHEAVHTFLSGVLSKHGKGRPEGNITLDQKAAEFVGSDTRYPSLQIGIGGGSISWTRNNVEIPPITRLETMFDALFLETSESKRKRLSDSNKLNASILDIVGEDAVALKKRISRNDVEKLDEYFTSIREVEKRLTQSEAWLRRPKPKTEYQLPRPLPDDFYGEVPVFYELMKLALQTDSTRIVTCGIDGWSGDSGLPGVTQGYHFLTHHGHDESRLAQLSIIETFHTTAFANFLEDLRRTQISNDASLLDKTMVLFGSGMGNASSHSNRDLPLILAGGGFNHGENKKYPKISGRQTPACNLYVSMLQRFGLEVDQFGTSTGALDGFS